MKKTLKVALGFILVSTLLILSGCDKESSITKSHIDPIFEKALTEFNESQSLRSKKGMILTGSVSFLKNENDEIGIVLDEADGSKLFFLQTKQLSEEFTEQSLPNAVVLFLKKMLIVHSKNNSKNYLFTLPNISYQDNSYLKDLKIDEEHIGYGLGMKSNAGEIDFRNGCTCSCFASNDPEIPECDSGGVGSSLCSQTSGGDSCEVECYNGYYACCNC